MPISATNYDGSLNYSVAEMDDLAKPNLLINADFSKGVINQKGETTYTNYEPNFNKHYTIEMWLVQQKCSVTVGDGYITIANTGTAECYFAQSIETDVKKGILTIQVKSLTGSATGAAKNTTGTNYNSSLRMGLNTIKFDSSTSIQSVFISLPASSSVQIEYIKLEEGDAFTGMPVWDQAVELLKCQRCFEVKTIPAFGMSGTFAQFHALSQATIFLTGDATFVEKRKTPTITVKNIGTNSGNLSDVTASAVSPGKKTCTVFQTNTAVDRPYLNFTCWIDSYDY